MELEEMIEDISGISVLSTDVSDDRGDVGMEVRVGPRSRSVVVGNLLLSRNTVRYFVSEKAVSSSDLWATSR